MIVDRIRHISSELKAPVGILVDLAGPKFRLGELEGDQIHCDLGDEFFFVKGESQARHELVSSYEPLVDELFG